MSEPKTYTIGSFKDIFDKVPTNRIALCMAELAEAMVQAKTFLENAKAETGEDIEMVWPETVEWVDDDKGETGFLMTDIDSGEIVECTNWELSHERH